MGKKDIIFKRLSSEETSVFKANIVRRLVSKKSHFWFLTLAPLQTPENSVDTVFQVLEFFEKKLKEF